MSTEIANWRVDDIIGLTRLGTNSFSGAEPLLHAAMAVAKSLMGQNPEELPLPLLDPLDDALKSVQKAVAQTRSFGGEGADAPGQREQHIANMGTCVATLMQTASPALTFFPRPSHGGGSSTEVDAVVAAAAAAGAKQTADLVERTQIDIDKHAKALEEKISVQAGGLDARMGELEARARSTVEQQAADFQKLKVGMEASRAGVDEHAEKVKRIVGDAEKDASRVREIAGFVGVAKNSHRFGDLATEHAKEARTWLWRTNEIAAVAVAYCITMMLVHLGEWVDIPLPHLIAVGAGQLSILSILYFLVVFCGRSYRANRHNEILNRHRQESLSTFELFVASAESAAVRDTILLQAAQTIFAQQATGQVAPDAEPQSPTQVLQVIRDATKQ